MIPFTEILKKSYDNHIDIYITELVENFVMWFPETVKTHKCVYDDFMEIKRNNNMINKEFSINTNAI